LHCVHKLILKKTRSSSPLLKILGFHPEILCVLLVFIRIFPDLVEAVFQARRQISAEI